MILNPKNLVKNEVITGLLSEKEQIQQNGVDLTVSQIFALADTPSVLCIKDRKQQQRIERNPDENGVIKLEPGVYDILFNEAVKIPNGVCGQIISRSSLNRTGNFILSGVYDAGFENQLGAMLHVVNSITIEKNVRLGQLVMQTSEEGDLYKGIYNTTTVIN